MTAPPLSVVFLKLAQWRSGEARVAWLDPSTEIRENGHFLRLFGRRPSVPLRQAPSYVWEHQQCSPPHKGPVRFQDSHRGYASVLFLWEQGRGLQGTCSPKGLRWGDVLDPGAGWILSMTCATLYSGHWLPPSQEFKSFHPLRGIPVSVAGAPEGPCWPLGGAAPPQASGKAPGSWGTS